MSKKVKKPDFYRLAAKKLKEAHLLDYDLRKKFTPGQKAAISRAWHDSQKRAAAEWFHTKKIKKVVVDDLRVAEFSNDKKEIARLNRELDKGHKHGLGKYEIRHLKNKKELRDFKKAGYLVVGNKVYLKKFALTETVHVKKIKSPITGELTTTVERRYKNKTKNTFVAPDYHIMRELDRLKDTPLPPHTHCLVSIAGNSPFGERTTYKDLMKYVQNWQPKDGGSNELREKLISEMTLVHTDIFN